MSLSTILDCLVGAIFLGMVIAIGIMALLLHNAHQSLQVAQSTEAVCLGANSQLSMSLDHQNQAVDKLSKDSAIREAVNTKAALALKKQALAFRRKSKTDQVIFLKQQMITAKDSCKQAENLIDQYIGQIGAK